MKAKARRPLEWMLTMVLSAGLLLMPQGCGKSQNSSKKSAKGVITLETRWEDGVLTMPCTVNGLRLRFIFDTGASSVCISSTEALFMLKNGYLGEKDIGGSVQSIIANGDIVDSTEITLREIEVGGIVLKNVQATVTHGLDAPLLFGQSAISKLGTIQIEDGKVTIIPGTGVSFTGDESTKNEDNSFDANEYKRQGWLVEHDGVWSLSEQTPIEAKLRYYRSEALQRKDISKMLALAELYAEGVGVVQDFTESFKWYRMAAENGDATGQNNTGYNYLFGKGVRQDKAEARRWFAMAAAKGHAMSQNNLGIMWQMGDGGPQDLEEAAKWYRCAAEQGVVGAQLELGVMYKRGEGVAKNLQEALNWFKKAAEQRDARAMTEIAWMYENGIGVEQNNSEALRLYKKAADIGNDMAERNYRRLLHEKEEHDCEMRKQGRDDRP